MNLLLKNNEVLAVKCNQIFLNSYISHIIYTNCGLGVRHAPSFETPTQLGIYTLTYSMPGLLTGIGLEVTLQARPSPHCIGHFHSLTPREVQGEFFFLFQGQGSDPGPWAHYANAPPPSYVPSPGMEKPGHSGKCKYPPVALCPSPGFPPSPGAGVWNSPMGE